MVQKHKKHTKTGQAWIKRVLEKKSLVFIICSSTFIRQEQLFTKINKPYIIGILSQCTLTISNRFNIIPPKLKDSKRNIFMHQTSNPCNFLNAWWISMIQIAAWPTLKDLPKAFINFMNYASRKLTFFEVQKWFWCFLALQCWNRSSLMLVWVNEARLWCWLWRI